MFRLSVATTVVVSLALSAPALATDACSLIPRADASGLLGQPVSSVTPTGPERDDDTGGQLSYCTYRTSNAALVVSVVEFGSPAEARKQLTVQMVRERMDADDAKVSEEAGIGERLFWAYSSKGAMYTFLKKAKVVGVGLGGQGIGNPTSHKAALRNAAAALASKL